MLVGTAATVGVAVKGGRGKEVSSLTFIEVGAVAVADGVSVDVDDDEDDDGREAERRSGCNVEVEARAEDSVGFGGDETPLCSL